MAHQVWISPGNVQADFQITSQIFVQPPSQPRQLVLADALATDQHALRSTTNSTTDSRASDARAFATPDCSLPSASRRSDTMNFAKPSRRELQRQRKKAARWELQNTKECPRFDGVDNDHESVSKLTKALISIGRKGVNQAWTKVKLEFEVQVLVWKSRPRCDNSGLDVLAERGAEAQAYAQIRLLLSLGSDDLNSVSRSVAEATWMHALTHAMSRSLHDLIRSQNNASELLKIPFEVLSTGCMAECAAENGSEREKDEIYALVLSVATAEDASLVRADVLKLPEKIDENELHHAKEVKLRADFDGVPSLWESVHYDVKTRVKVKNTFLDFNTKDSDDDRSVSSSARCSSAPPSRCAGTPSGVSSEYDSDDDFVRA